jgi:16S rRNA (guanine1207-N2)-methyltransferase
MLMSDHYYSQSPKVESNEHKIRVTLRSKEMNFYTDSGVFSKNSIDFGSQLLIETIIVPEEACVLDVGCGYGPIGLTLAKESEHHQVTLVDVNQRALSLAQKNAKINQIENITIMESDLLEAVRDQLFDIIVSNPPIRAGKQVVHSLFEQSYQSLRDQGELWIVIQKKQGLESAIKKLETLFEKVDEVTKKKGYRIIRAKKDRKS